MAQSVRTTETRQITIDNISGEVLDDVTNEETSTTTYDRNPEPDFIKVYLDHIAEFVNVPKASMRIFWLLTQYMSYAQNEQRIYINAAMKRDIAHQLNVTPDYVTKNLTQLVRKNILKRVDTGTYIVNPQYVGRGKWRDIKELRTTFDYVNGTITTTRN